jgi:4-aminobutyrate aminotransferase
MTPPSPNVASAEPTTRSGLSREQIVEKHREFMFPNIANYYAEPIALERGEAQYVWDVDGRKYLDFFGGILTVSVGHAHPHVVAAVREQIGRMSHSSTLYPSEKMVTLAERLANMVPIERPEGRAPKTYFTNSGTEADETAVHIAQQHTGRQEIIALRHGYSGRSALSRSLTAQAPWRGGPTQIAVVKHTVSAYCYRCPFGLTYPSCEVKCAQDLEEKIQTETSGEIAALLAEPIQGVGGFITPPKEFFPILVGIARKYGGLFIDDEVQTGFGRTGRYMFGIEHWGVRPDIMTFAKGLANGTPVGATVARADVGASARGLTISTFGGNPVTMAAAHATLDVMEGESLVDRVASVGRYFRDKLDALAEKYPVIGEVRGMGLMQALEFVKDRKTKEPASDVLGRFFEETKARGLLIGKGGLYNNVVRISPPMIVGTSDVDEAIRIFDESLAASCT